jgi:hypothetical protein
MNVRTIIAALAGGVTMFLLGFVFFGLLFAEYFRANMVQYPGLDKDPPVFWAIFVFNLAWAAIIAFVLDYAGRGGWAEGAKVGAIIMALIAIAAHFDFFAFLNIHKTVAPILVHVLVVTFIGGLTGAVIGLVKGNSAGS